MKTKFCVALISACGILLNSAMLAQVKSLDPTKAITQYKLRSWTVDDGLPSDAITSIIQSRNGYIWITTYGGVSKFDGVNFTNYSSQNTKALNTEAAKTIYEDKNGIIWVATQKGVAYIKNNTFYRDDKLNPLDNLDIESLFMDTKNRLWIGTNFNDLYRFDGDSLVLLSNFNKITTHSVFALCEDKNGTIWIGTENGELINYKNDSFTLCDNNIELQILSFYQDHEGIIWVATSKGIYIINNNKLQKIPELNIRFAVSIVEDINGSLWISSDIDGLMRYNKLTHTIEILNEKKGLPNNRVEKILFDKQGNLWGGTYRNGLFQIIDSKFICFSESEGLHSNLNTAIIEFDTNEYWVANERGTINVIKNGIVSNYKPKIPIASSQIKHMLKDSKGNVWLSTYSGLLKIGKNSETLYNIENGFPDNFIRKTYEDIYGNIWVATNRKGVVKITPSGYVLNINASKGLTANYVMTITNYKDNIIVAGTKMGMNFIKNDTVIKTFTIDNGLPDNFIFNIYKDNEDILWITTNSGISRYENESFINYSIESGLATNNIYDIVEDDFGYFWMPGPKGVMKISKQQLNDFAHYKVSKIDYVFFDKTDGMKSSVCLGATKSIKDSKGNIWFLTSKGIAGINPKESEVNKRTANKYIESVYNSDTSFSTNNTIALPPKYNRFNIKYTALDLDYPKKILFKYKLEPFDKEWIETGNKRTASYTNISPGNYVFKVKSTNSNGVWSDNFAQVRINVLPTWYQTVIFKLGLFLFIFIGLYMYYRLRINRIKKQRNFLELEVKERTEDLNEVNTQLEERQADLERKQEEITAQAENLAQMNKELQDHKDHLEQLVKERTIDLEKAKEKAEESDRLKSAFLANMSHEIRTPMNAIMGFSNLLVNPRIDEKSKKEMVVHINDNINALLQLIENIITISKIESGELKVNIRKVDLQKILKNIYVDFDSRLEMSSTDAIKFVLENNSNSQNIELMTDESHLITIIKNLLDNAFKFTEKGEVSFGYHIDKDQVTIYVKDSGIGLSTEQKVKIFKSFTKAELSKQKLYRGAGLGLSICKNLVENLGGNIWVKSEIDIGSTFYISIPKKFKKSHEFKSSD